MDSQESWYAWGRKSFYWSWHWFERGKLSCHSHWKPQPWKTSSWNISKNCHRRHAGYRQTRNWNTKIGERIQTFWQTQRNSKWHWWIKTKMEAWQTRYSERIMLLDGRTQKTISAWYENLSRVCENKQAVHTVSYILQHELDTPKKYIVRHNS